MLDILLYYIREVYVLFNQTNNHDARAAKVIISKYNKYPCQ